MEKYQNIFARFLIKIFSVPIVLYLTYAIHINPSDTFKLAGMLLLSVACIIFPVFLVSFIRYCLLCILIPIMFITKHFLKTINLIFKSNFPTEVKKTLEDEEYELKLFMLFSYVLITTILLVFTFYEITNQNYITIVATEISILYGSAISRYIEPLLIIAGLDIELLKMRNNKNDK